MTMLSNIFKAVVAVALVIFFSVPTNTKAAYTSNCQCQCNCNCTCTCNGGSGNKASGDTGGQVQPAGEKEKAVMAETKRVTDAHASEDNRKQYSGYKMQLADTLESSAKNSGFTVVTKTWKSTSGDYDVVQQEFSRNNWTLKIQYRYNNGFLDSCHPVWLAHNGTPLNSGNEWDGWAWSSSQTLYELLDMLSKL